MYKVLPWYLLGIGSKMLKYFAYRLIVLAYSLAMSSWNVLEL